MKRALVGITQAVLALSLAGCATTAIRTDNATRRGTFYGSLGVTGYGNAVTIEKNSRLDHISIIGDRNNVEVEEGVTLSKIEIWGSNNTVGVPEGLVLRISEVGKNNRILHRTPSWRSSTEAEVIGGGRTLENPAP